MDQHKALYDTGLLSRRNHLQINRDNHRAARSKRREESFFNNRVISVSPTPKKIFATNKQTMPANDDAMASEQENINPQHPQTSVVSRKKDYLNRFMQWRTEYKQRQAPEKTQNDQTAIMPQQQGVAEATFEAPAAKRRSLYVIVDFKSKKNATQDKTDSRTRTVVSTSTAARGAPPNLKSTFAGTVTRAKHKQTTSKTTSLKAPTVKPSMPTVTVNKPAKQGPSAATHDSKPAVAARKPPAALTAVKPMRTLAGKKAATASAPVPAPASIAPGTVTAPAPASTAPGTVAAPVPASTAPGTVAAPAPAAGTVSLASAAKPTALSRKPTKVATKPTTCVTNSTTKPKMDAVALPPNRPVNLVTQPFDKPANRVNIVKPIRGGGGAAGKLKVKSNPPLKAVKCTVSSTLAKRMKVKKTDPSANNKEKNNKKIDQLKQAFFGGNLGVDGIDELPDTPLERLSVENPFQATSTQCNKSNNSSHHLLDLYRDLTKLSPLGADETCSGSTATSHTKSVAKRQLLTAEIAKGAQEEQQQQQEQPKRKFNFARYSVGEPLLETPAVNKSKSRIDTEGNDVAAEKTMTPTQDDTCKPNYLSPFVSVSRGKVNSQTERSKRNSMYLQEEDKLQPETPVAVRRTLESVQYFRLQLENEIKRLNGLCEEWTQYSGGENEARLVETGGKDMIDAAIGQTKLLTSKKLMQFSSLIDRCEAGATGIGLRANDGSEDTKPVLAEDLEGWWDMMRLQGDNVDKRFNNLQRWKANNWVDPDEVIEPKPKAKTKRKAAPKAAKPTSKGSVDLKSFMRKAAAEARKKREQKESEETVLNATTPKHHFIVVRDRKSFSPARTVLRVSTGGSGSRPSISGGSGRKSIGTNILLRSAIMGAVAQQQTSPAPLPSETPRRMSILKTPGTKKQDSNARRVIFSAKKKVRKFQFAFEEGIICGDVEPQLGGDKLEDCEEDMSMEKNTSSQNSQTQEQKKEEEDKTPPTPQSALRTCSLRNRKVKIRYSDPDIKMLSPD